jgi:uncharacterized lipoprotein YbaY
VKPLLFRIAFIVLSFLFLCCLSSAAVSPPSFQPTFSLLVLAQAVAEEVWNRPRVPLPRSLFLTVVHVLAASSLASLSRAFSGSNLCARGKQHPCQHGTKTMRNVFAS